MTIHPRATIVPFHDDILAVAARHIIDHGTALPDLTATTVLLPDLQFAPRLRRHLLDAARHRGHAALLGPAISTLDEWLCDQTRIKQVIPGRARRELLLVEVLQQHPSVFGGSDPWQISASLVTLFDELTLNRVQVPQDLDAFTRQLQTAYGIGDRLPEPLGMEASVVHRLWQAWHVQLGAEDLLDPGIACLQRLAMTRDGPASGHLYLVGFDDLSTAREEWLAGLLSSGRVHCFLYPRAHTPDDIAASPVWTLPDQDTLSGSDSNPVAGCLDAVFRIGAASPGERARAYITQQPDSPLRGHLSILTANSAEQEARAIDLQVRRWLLEQRQPIGIVTGDRRLARRVRALLERAGVSLQDSGGWALSTTSTAAALERWLETVEEDFAHQPLLDVLKSPFVFPDNDREQLGNTVFRLEQDIILHENIARGLARYRKHIELRRERLPASWTSDATQALQILLNRLDQAAEPLRPFVGNTCARPAAILEQLRVSLESLGMWAAFDNDLAGQRILGEWQLLYDAAQHSEVEMSWIEFRAWFGTALERHNFRPATAGSPVLLLTLEQAQLGQYGGVIVGACDREHLPAVSAHSPFFNDPVRRELGLPVCRPAHLAPGRQWRTPHARPLAGGHSHLSQTGLGRRSGRPRAGSPAG
jgi:ATP-dependent helicase/nuclease subunit B